MKSDGLHFKGKYRGLFKAKASGTTHAASFYDLTLTHLEIRDIVPISDRDWQKEKVGDFLYVKSIRPRSKWLNRGVDLAILKDDSTAFSENIDDVVLSQHSRERLGFSPVRHFQSFKTKDSEQWIEGVIHFSLPDNRPKPIRPVLPPIKEETPVLKVKDTTYTIPNLVSGDEDLARQTKPGCFRFLAPPSTPLNGQINTGLSNHKGCLTVFNRGQHNPTGQLNSAPSKFAASCLSRIFKLLAWILFLVLLFQGLTFLASLLTERVAEEHIKKENGKIDVAPPRLDPNQDTLGAFPWNYLVDHKVEWSDFINNRFSSTYSTSTFDFEASKKRRQAWSRVPIEDEISFFQDLYADLFAGDRKKLDSIVNYFDVQHQAKSLNPFQTSEMVVAFIQEIPYVLVHDASCSEASSNNQFAFEYHSKGNPCLPNIFAGVQSPYEFLHNLKGDCDTRSLLAFAILDKLNIGASVWISREYGHSILGVAVPANSPHYKEVSGTRYYATELTAKGFRVGMIAPEQTNMKNWKIVLTNK
jgi:hypothetical protein